MHFPQSVPEDSGTLSVSVSASLLGCQNAKMHSDRLHVCLATGDWSTAGMSLREGRRQYKIGVPVRVLPGEKQLDLGWVLRFSHTGYTATTRGWERSLRACAKYEVGAKSSLALSECQSTEGLEEGPSTRDLGAALYLVGRPCLVPAGIPDEGDSFYLSKKGCSLVKHSGPI